MKMNKLKDKKGIMRNIFCAVILLMFSFNAYAVEINGSVAVYRLRSVDGDYVDLKVDYKKATGQIENVLFTPEAAPQSDGEVAYVFETEEGYDLIITFNYVDGVMQYAQVKPDYTPDPSRGNTMIFTLTDIDFDDITIRFTWGTEGRAKGVDVRPKVNPFK